MGKLLKEFKTIRRLPVKPDYLLIPNNKKSRLIIIMLSMCLLTLPAAACSYAETYDSNDIRNSSASPILTINNSKIVSDLDSSPGEDKTLSEQADNEGSQNVSASCCDPEYNDTEIAGEESCCSNTSTATQPASPWGNSTGGSCCGR